MEDICIIFGKAEKDDILPFFPIIDFPINQKVIFWIILRCLGYRLLAMHAA